MLTAKFSQRSTSVITALVLGITTIIPLIYADAVSAKPHKRFSRQYTSVNLPSPLALPAGTIIPVIYPESETIRVAKGEIVSLKLQTAVDIKDFNGRVLIPANSEIVGEIQPTDSGARFVAEQIRINSDTWLYLNATSKTVNQVESVRKGANTADILTGTVAGAGAATIISGVTGDRRIDALEVLAGAAVGTLAGWALPTAGILGGGSQEVFVINPTRDLTLTLQQDLLFSSSR